MPDIFGQPTPAEAISAIRSGRVLSDAARRKSGIPSNEKAGRVAVANHVVTSAENAANSLVERFPDFEVIESVHVQLRSSAGLVKTSTPTITISGNAVTIASDATMVDNDIYTITVKGIKS